MLEKMVDEGVNVFRLNFSHGNHSEHGEMLEAIKRIRKEKIKPIAILQDLSGSKIRTGDFNTPEVNLVVGQDFILSTDENIEGNAGLVYVDHHTLPNEVERGDRIVLDDGRVEMEVLDKNDSEIYCRVLEGALIRGGRGLTVPGKLLSFPALSDKDMRDMKFGLDMGVDFVALSFVQSAENITTLRSFIKENAKDFHPDIIAKIETRSALDNFDSILKESDGIMVARGDLAVDISPEEVPMAQKMVIDRSNTAGKPVITATQMLESMVDSPVPTRAETSDVANAILDGTDAVMLSAETSIGNHPLQAIEVMKRTALQIEKNYPERKRFDEKLDNEICAVNAITAAVVRVTHDVDAKLMVALTDSGFTGRMLARHKPKVPIVAMATDEHVYNKLSLSFGCVPVYIEGPEDIGRAFWLVKEYVIKNDLAREGDRVVVTAGVPFEQPEAKTNMLFVENI